MRFSLFILGILLYNSTQLIAQNSQFDFQQDSWKSVTKMAKKSNKPIFVQAMSQHCTACDEFELGILTDGELASMYNTSFVLFKLDSNTKDRSKLESNLSISAYPTSVFVDAKGQVIHKYVGLPSRIDMENMAKRVLSKKRTLAYYNKLHKSNTRAMSSDELLDYATILLHASENYSPIADAYFARQTLEQLATTQNLNAIIAFTDDINSREFAFIARENGSFGTEGITEGQVQFKIEDVISITVNSYVMESKDIRVLQDSLNKIFSSKEIKNMDLVYSRVLLDYYGFVNIDSHKYFRTLVEYMNSHFYLMTVSQIADKCSSVNDECEDREVIDMAIHWIDEAINMEPDNPNLYMISVDLMIKMGRFNEAKDISIRMMESCENKLTNPDKVMELITKKIEIARSNYRGE
ncbi:MAG: DUF255 domain-containing protein [Bacteroidales bacterium]|nr:DUF255 domain-containing protein [Bacteroidales bacterium]